MDDRTEPMRRARRIDTDRKAKLVIGATRAAAQRGEHPTIASVARSAGVGRKFIYDHPELHAAVEHEAAKLTAAQVDGMTATSQVTNTSLRADLANARSQIQRLAGQVRALERRLSETEGLRLSCEGAIPPNLIETATTAALQRQTLTLEEELGRMKRRLSTAEEELEASRKINRELMARLNGTTR